MFALDTLRYNCVLFICVWEYLNPVVVQTLLCPPVYYLELNHVNNQWSLAVMWLSKQLPAIWCHCMLDQYHPNKLVRPIRIVLNHRAYENHSIDHQLTPYTLFLDVAILNRAKCHRQHVAVRHVLLMHLIQGQHEYKYDHSIVQQQINPTKNNMQKFQIKKNGIIYLIKRKKGSIFHIWKWHYKITFPGFVPIVNSIRPFGSFVRNLNEMELCLPVSHGGKI